MPRKPTPPIDLDDDRKDLIPAEEPLRRVVEPLDLDKDRVALGRGKKPKAPVKDPWMLGICRYRSGNVGLFVARESRFEDESPRLKVLREHDDPVQPEGWDLAIRAVREARTGSIDEVERLILRAMLEAIDKR